MRVLVTGANGFIGRHITAALLAAGHNPVAAVRAVPDMKRIFPGIAVLPADLNRDTAAETWPISADSSAAARALAALEVDR